MEDSMADKEMEFLSKEETIKRVKNKDYSSVVMKSLAEYAKTDLDMGERLFYGYIHMENYDSAKELGKKIAHSNKFVCARLALLYLFDDDLQNYKKYIVPAAEAGSDVAIRFYSLSLYWGKDGFEQDKEKAIAIAKKAAGEGKMFSGFVFALIKR